MFSKIGKIGDRKATLTPPRQFGLPEGETLSLEEERSVVSRAIKVFDEGREWTDWRRERSDQCATQCPGKNKGMLLGDFIL